MVMEKDEGDQQKANSLLRLLEKKIAAQGPQEKRIAQASRSCILCLKTASEWAGWYDPAGLFRGRFVNVGLEWVCAFI